MATFQPLKGISGVFDSTLNNDIQDGIVEYFDWALLEKGNYFNVTANETSPNGEDMSRLRLSSNAPIQQVESGKVLGKTGFGKVVYLLTVLIHP
jgi:hypothetical protein